MCMICEIVTSKNAVKFCREDSKGHDDLDEEARDQ